jgi:hypothetical protein
MVADGFPQLMTQQEAADYLGAPVEDVLDWARDGKLLVAAWTETGGLLFYKWRVDRDGKALAAQLSYPHFRPKGTVPSRALRRMPPDARTLVCGCVQTLTGHPLFLCRDARSLENAAHLTEALALAVSNNPFFQKLAQVARSAFERHVDTSPRDMILNSGNLPVLPFLEKELASGSPKRNVSSLTQR